MGKKIKKIKKILWERVGIKPSDLMLLAVLSSMITVIALTAVDMFAHEYIDWKEIAKGW